MGLASILAVLLAGALIGATGIGGVLVVPALTQLGSYSAAEAIAVSALGFGFPAVHALWLLRGEPALLRQCLPLMATSLAGACAGALLVHRVQAAQLMVGVAALVLLAGWRGLRGGGAQAASARTLGGVPMAALGALVGTGSALTGTGGPVLLIPLLLLCRQPIALTVAAAQAIQLPIALAATAAHALAGALDLAAGSFVGLLLLAGALAGHRVARALPARRLQQAVSVLLLGVGIWTLVALGWR